jgi:uncharacterized protein (TIGR02996 family)
MASEQLLVFLREVKDLPDDDTPRLILADWLQDHGDPRGEFIHLQVVRERLPEEERYGELYRRERQILGRHGLRWLGPFLDAVTGWEFRRGLVALEARADHLFGEGLASLEEDEAWIWVEELRLEETGAQRLARLARSPLLDRLSALDLTDNRLSDDGLARLLASERLGGLRKLRLSGNRIGARGAAHLARCAGLGRLQVLDLGRNRISEAGARELAESPHLAGLSKLVVSGNGVNLAGLSALRERFDARLEIAGG